MNKKDELAYPLPLGNENIYPSVAGLTKRELFAAMAMQGVLANPDIKSLSDDEIIEYAVIQADKLLAALEAEGE